VEKGINTPLSAWSERARAPDGRTDAFCLISAFSGQMLPEGLAGTSVVELSRLWETGLPATLQASITLKFTLCQKSHALDPADF
jgi:uncharacterized membrane protein